MKLILKTAAVAAALALTACGGGQKGNNASTSTNAAQMEVNQLENASSTLENVAGNASGNAAGELTNQAEAVSNAAENQSQALEKSGSNAH